MLQLAEMVIECIIEIKQDVFLLEYKKWET